MTDDLRLRPGLWNSRAWIAGLGSGAAASLVNLLHVPILTPETPLFLFGGAFVLAATVTFGLVTGLIAVTVVLVASFVVPLWGVSVVAMAGGLIYVAEVVWVGVFFRRIGSIPLTSVLFWFALGWVLDLGVYRLGMGLDGGYLLLLFVKQLLNGVAVAVLAELLVELAARVRWAGKAEKRPAVPIAWFAFNRVVLLTLVPVTVLSLILARTGYERVHAIVSGDNEMAALQTAGRMSGALAQRRNALIELIAEVQTGGDPFERDLSAIFQRFPDVEVLATVGLDGRVVDVVPEFRDDGTSRLGMDLRSREYFREAVEGEATLYSDLFEITPAVDGGDPAVSIAIVEPMRGGGAVTGFMVMALDPARLLETGSALPPFEGGSVTLFDRSQRLLFSRGGPELPAGAPIDSVFAPSPDLGDSPLSSRIAGRSRLNDLTFILRRDDDAASRLGISMRNGAFERMGSSGRGVVVARPGEYLRARFAPTSWTIVFVFLTVTALVYGVVLRFTRRISEPYRATAELAARIALGDGERPGLSGLSSSRLAEVAQLSTALKEMDKVLWRREIQAKEREEGLQSQLLQAQKMEAIGLLAGGVAHDFNNSLTPIMGYAGMGRRDADDEALRGYFEEILRAASHARDVTAQLLAFGRKQTLREKPVDLPEAVRRDEALIRNLFRENVSIELELLDVGGWVRADPTHLHQVLMNLAINAQEAMPDGGTLSIRVSRAAEPIGYPEPDDPPPGPFVVLTVSDTGEGIDPEDLPNIFEPFFTTKPGERGAGLGLATVYGVVRQQGGWITVDSHPGEGATFSVYLPEIISPAEGEELSANEPTEAVITAGRILVVEDEASVRRFVRTILSREELEVEAFPDAESALERFRSGPEDFDMLLSDVVLPGMNGYELFRAIERTHPGLPTLFMTGYSHDVLKEAGLPERVRVLNKPFGGEELVDAVSRVLGERSREGADET